MASTVSTIPSTHSLAETVSSAALVPLSLAQYQRMIQQGIVAEDSSVELLRGVLVRKDRSSPGGDPTVQSALHALVVSLLTQLAFKISDAQRHMKIQSPIACPPDGAPEPDGSIIRATPRDYLTRLPGKGEVFCVIEVAHSSLGRDREDKLPIYAAAGIAQYLIINLYNETIEIYEGPDPADEQYRSKSTAVRGTTIQLRIGDSGETFSLDAAEMLP